MTTLSVTNDINRVELIAGATRKREPARKPEKNFYASLEEGEKVLLALHGINYQEHYATVQPREYICTPQLDSAFFASKLGTLFKNMLNDAAKEGLLLAESTASFIERMNRELREEGCCLGYGAANLLQKNSYTSLRSTAAFFQATQNLRSTIAINVLKNPSIIMKEDRFVKKVKKIIEEQFKKANLYFGKMIQLNLSTPLLDASRYCYQRLTPPGQLNNLNQLIPLAKEKIKEHLTLEKAIAEVIESALQAKMKGLCVSYDNLKGGSNSWSHRIVVSLEDFKIFDNRRVVQYTSTQELANGLSHNLTIQKSAASASLFLPQTGIIEILPVTSSPSKEMHYPNSWKDDRLYLPSFLRSALRMITPHSNIKRGAFFALTLACAKLFPSAITSAAILCGLFSVNHAIQDVLKQKRAHLG